MKTRSTTAATAATSKATTIKVKSLKWLKGIEHDCIYAETPFCQFTIGVGVGCSLRKPYELVAPIGEAKYFATIDDAKKAAQEWYNETVLECIEQNER
jgi:hypothetical protein